MNNRYRFLVVCLVVFCINAVNIFAGGATAYTWVGVSTDWTSSSNWTPSGGPPASDNDVTIPASPSGGNFPVISGTMNAYCSNLTINTGATVYQIGGTLNVYHEYKNKGTFNATGGTIVFAGDGGLGTTFEGTNQFFNVIVNSGVDPKFDRTISIAGNFTNNNSGLDETDATFIFNGTGDQTIYSASTPVPSKNTFGKLVINKPSGTIKLLSNVAVKTSFTQTNGTLDENGYTLWVGGVPMPVELSSFSAIVADEGVKLVWRTETEVNNYGFEIQKSVEKSQGTEWSAIGFVFGNGNSNSPKDYSFLDKTAKTGKYSYRLKQIDSDGSFEYSKIIEVDIDNITNGFVLEQNYPNPFNPTTTIRFTLPESGNVSLHIYNPIGEVVATPVNGLLEAGNYNYYFNAENLPSGMYVYQLNALGKTLTKKMLFLK